MDNYICCNLTFSINYSILFNVKIVWNVGGG